MHACLHLQAAEKLEDLYWETGVFHMKHVAIKGTSNTLDFYKLAPKPNRNIFHFAKWWYYMMILYAISFDTKMMHSSRIVSFI